MESKKKNSILSIETDCVTAVSTVKIHGSEKDVMFNWIALTHQVCKSTHIEPAVLAIAMPTLLEEYVQKSWKEEFHTNPPGDRK